MVRAEAWPDPRDADELHDALVSAGFLTDGEASRASRAGTNGWPSSRDRAAPRVASRRDGWHEGVLDRRRAPPRDAGSASTACSARSADRRAGERAPSRVDARDGARRAAARPHGAGRPDRATALGSPLGLDHDAAVDGAARSRIRRRVLCAAGSRPAAWKEEWCDRRLLARIHRAHAAAPARRDPAGLASRLHAVPVRVAARRSVDAAHRPRRRSRRDRAARRLRAGGRCVGARTSCRAREGYDPSMLDLLCYSGEAAWARLTKPPAVNPSALLPPRPIRATPIALFRPRSRRRSGARCGGRTPRAEPFVSDTGPRGVARAERNRARGSCTRSRRRSTPRPTSFAMRSSELVWAGLVASDGFAGLRAIWSESPRRRRACSAADRRRRSLAGRTLVDASATEPHGQAIARPRSRPMRRCCCAATASCAAA